MTDSATVRDTPASALPRWWWARGLNLRERLSAPRPPAGHAARAGSWSVGDRAGFTARLAHLSLSDELTRALGAELPERLGARAAKPRWAQFIEQAVSAAPDSPSQHAHVRRDAGGPAAAGALAFLPAMQPLIALAWAAVAAGLALPEEEHEPLRAAFEAQLGGRLVRQAGRALAVELARTRATGQLVGSTPQERFAAFVAGIGTRAGLAGLFAKYPVLGRMQGQTALDAADAMTELAARLDTDRSRLAELSGGADPGPLRRIEADCGDPHQGHRAVAILHFAGGDIVYKPRPLDQHAFLDEAVAWLNAKVPGLGLRTPRTVRGEGYGWIEFVEYRRCVSTAEADRFYRRQGALLALLYAVEGVDVHYENLIASGDQPVLVDAETLLHSGIPYAGTLGADPAAAALQSSVHRTGLLPHLLIGEYGALDISALGRSEDGVYPSDALRWEAAGTDEMRVVRGPATSPAARNQPLARTGVAGHADHRAALLDGFRSGYDAIARHRAELLAHDAFPARWAQAPARLIVRPTRLYATLLEESAHPDLLCDALTRDAVFALLWTESHGDPARQRLIEDEIDDLWRGDVPLFVHRPAHTAVWTSRGARLDAVLPAASLDVARAKIAAMGEEDRYDQEWVIAATLAVSAANAATPGLRSALARRPAPAEVPTPTRLLAAACGIADEIVARAMHGGDRVNWLVLEQVAGAHWAVLPMGGGLAEGYCGAALFLAQIGELASARRYTAMAREAVRPLPALLSKLAGDPELSAAVGPGALSGLGGLVYALIRLSSHFGDRPGEGVGACLPDALTALTHAALAYADLADAALTPDSSTNGPAETGALLGFADGLAGALAAATVAYEATGACDAGALARRLADRLLPFADCVFEPGFAGGGAGIGWSLLRYAGSPPFASAAKAHAATGALLLDTAVEAALRTAADQSWYSGLSGVLLAALSVPPDAPDRPGRLTEAELDECVRTLAAPEPRQDLSLRHGAIGRFEPLLVLAGRGHDGARETLARRAGGVLGLAGQQGHRCGTPDHVPSPGLLTGLSGIGYGLLRLGFPDAVPPIPLLGAASAAEPAGVRLA